MTRGIVIDGEPAALESRGPGECPWYVAAVMALHYALGSLMVLAAAGMILAFIADLLWPTGELDVKLAALAAAGTLALAAVGLVMLYSGQCVRRREKRRLTIFCGSLLFFGGQLALIGLLTLVGLTRERAIEYYEATLETPAFPVVPTDRKG